MSFFPFTFISSKNFLDNLSDIFIPIDSNVLFIVFTVIAFEFVFEMMIKI